MSLINKMLKDLEKRDAFLNENSDQVLDGLYSAYDLELTNKKKSYTFLSFSIFFITICFILIMSYFLFSETISQYMTSSIESGKSEVEITKADEFKQNANDVAYDVEKKSVEEIVSVPKSRVNLVQNDFSETNKVINTLKLDEQIVLDDESYSSVESKINRIQSIQFEKDNTGINLIMKMPDEIDYLVYGLTNPNRTVIEVKNAKLDFKLEELEPVEPIVAIRYSINDENRFKLVLESDALLTIRKSVTDIADNGNNLIVMMDYHWVNDDAVMQEDAELNAFVEQQVELEKDTVFKGDLIKTPVNQNSNAYAEKIFQQAYRAYKRGEISESLKKLNLALNQDPGHTRARTTLALVLSEKDHYELAYSVLNEGLIQYPEKIEWTKMYARLLLNEGKVIEAGNLLSKHNPKLVLNTDYYALQAAVLQQLNEHDEAARIYRDLLHVNPLKAVWWMGLGISLESIKRYSDALYAYQKASSNASLAKDSRQFITHRINRLNNILEDESS